MINNDKTRWRYVRCSLVNRRGSIECHETGLAIDVLRLLSLCSLIADEQQNATQLYFSRLVDCAAKNWLLLLLLFGDVLLSLIAYAHRPTRINTHTNTHIHFDLKIYKTIYYKQRTRNSTKLRSRAAQRSFLASSLAEHYCWIDRKSNRNIPIPYFKEKVVHTYTYILDKQHTQVRHRASIPHMTKTTTTCVDLCVCLCWLVRDVVMWKESRGRVPL